MYLVMYFSDTENYILNDKSKVKFVATRKTTDLVTKIFPYKEISIRDMASKYSHFKKTNKLDKVIKDKLK